LIIYGMIMWVKLNPVERKLLLASILSYIALSYNKKRILIRNTYYF